MGYQCEETNIGKRELEIKRHLLHCCWSAKNSMRIRTKRARWKIMSVRFMPSCVRRETRSIMYTGVVMRKRIT